MAVPGRPEQAQTFLRRAADAYNSAMHSVGDLMPTKIKKGFQSGVELMAPESRREITDEQGNRILSSISNYSTFSPNFKKELKNVKGISFTETPQEFIGAYAARLLTDAGTDSTRHLYWRYNHPMAIADKLIEKAAGPAYKQFNPTQKGLVGLAISAPTVASLGQIDITNPLEQFRSKGFAQTYAEEGAEDRRETGQPGTELLERLFLGRQGRPLKYETAKEDIPSLTPERYSNYMKNYYQDKGITGLGLIKGTMENLEGVPEARIVGFPIGLQAAGALAGGAMALRGALQTRPPVVTTKERRVISYPGGSSRVVEQDVNTRVPMATRKTASIALAGSLAGALVGNLTNQAIASLNNHPENLPSTNEYR